MTDEPELWVELKREYDSWHAVHTASEAENRVWRKIEDRARALLSPPVATKALPSHDELKHEMWEAFRNCDGTYGGIASACATVARQYLAALSHFAPPVSNAPILRMDAHRIEVEIETERATKYPHIPCNPDFAEMSARVAHRLAQPVPEVDKDAWAKRLAWLQYITAGGGHRADADALWRGFDSACKDGWRAVASAQEKSDG